MWTFALTRPERSGDLEPAWDSPLEPKSESGIPLVSLFPLKADILLVFSPFLLILCFLWFCTHFLCIDVKMDVKEDGMILL